jgi:hypothetical protein
VTPPHDNNESTIMQVILRDIRTQENRAFTFQAGPTIHPKPIDTTFRKCGSWSEFVRRFDPIDNPLYADTILIEQHDMVECPPEHVWTIVDDGEGGWLVTEGWHFVNRLAYVVARNPRVDCDTTYKTYRY